MHVAMVAGEASGDLLAAHLIGALRERRSGLLIGGIGGPRMQAEHFDSWFPMETLSVRGYFEVLRHYREIMRVRGALAKRILLERPSLFIGVDAPDFNLGLERQLRRAGIPTIQYVSPSVWAWRGWRLRRIARAASHMLVLFPFEPAIYEEAGVPVTYVGHPLADIIPLESSKVEARARLGITEAGPAIALLPGSRKSEMHYMAETFARTARMIHERMHGVQFICPTASPATAEMFLNALRGHGGAELAFSMIKGGAHDAVAAADLALVASGTATLEAALLGTPMVIAYRMSPFTWFMMRRMLYLPYVGLPNILAGELLVPEFLQEQATPEALSAAVISLMHDERRKDRQLERFREMHLTLRQNTANKAAEVVLEMLDRHNG